MEIGKVSPELLNKYVFKPSAVLKKRPEVKLRPGLGEDCAVLEIPGQVLVSADPITGATDDIGYLAVHVNANDIAAGGGEPIGILVTVLLPPMARESELGKIMAGVYRAAAEIGIEVLGGHTEVTDAVTRPLVSAAVVGGSKRPVSTAAAKCGDALIMTKYAGLEGTVIIANELPHRVKALGEDLYRRVLDLGSDISVIKEARIAADYGASAMHDVTEGGVLGACYELAESSKTGIFLELDKVPVLPETNSICREFGIDPYTLVSSGCLLISADPGLVSELARYGIPAVVIGRITQNLKEVCVGQAVYPLPPPVSDEIYKVIARPVQKKVVKKNKAT